MFRYKPVGWRGESYRHYLASKGVSTRRYSASKKMSAVLSERHPLQKELDERLSIAARAFRSGRHRDDVAPGEWSEFLRDFWAKNPDLKEKFKVTLSNASKEQWTDPEYRAIMSTPEFYKLRAEGLKRRWDTDEEYRTKQVEDRRSPERVEKFTAWTREYNSRPDVVEARRVSGKESWDELTDEQRSAAYDNLEKGRLAWQDPEKREELMAKRHAYLDRMRAEGEFLSDEEKDEIVRINNELRQVARRGDSLSVATNSGLVKVRELADDPEQFYARKMR